LDRANLDRLDLQVVMVYQGNAVYLVYQDRSEIQARMAIKEI
jgi:hypothetical protein